MNDKQGNDWKECQCRLIYYRIDFIPSPARDRETIECPECGQVLYEHNGSGIPMPRFKTLGEILKS